MPDNGHTPLVHCSVTERCRRGRTEPPDKRSDRKSRGFESHTLRRSTNPQGLLATVPATLVVTCDPARSRGSDDEKAPNGGLLSRSGSGQDV